HARHQVQVAADELRFEQFAESARIQRAARQHRRVGARCRAGFAVPVAHVLLEIDVADLGAVEAAHARGDRIRQFAGHGSRSCAGGFARRMRHSARVWPQMSVGLSSYGAGIRPGPWLREPSRIATRCEAVLAGSMQWITDSQPSTSKAYSIAAGAASVA